MLCVVETCSKKIIASFEFSSWQKKNRFGAMICLRNRDKGELFIERGFGRNFEIVSGFSVKKMRADLYHFVQKREFTMICNSFFFLRFIHTF